MPKIKMFPGKYNDFAFTTTYTLTLTKQWSYKKRFLISQEFKCHKPVSFWPQMKAVTQRLGNCM